MEVRVGVLGMIPSGLVRGLETLEIGGRYDINSIVEVGLNTKKGTGGKLISLRL